MLALTITNNQSIPLTISPKDLSGRKSRLLGKPVWTVLTGESSVKVLKNGLSALLISNDLPGVTTYKVEAVVSRDSGNDETISNIINLIVVEERTVSGKTATNLGLVAGAPHRK